MKTYIDVVKETVAHYSRDINRRATGDGFCRYITEDGRMCAVGRCLKYPNFLEDKFSGMGIQAIPENVFQFFKDEYTHLDNLLFWKSLQFLHDNDSYWDNNGLTEWGESEYGKLLGLAKELDKEVSKYEDLC